MGEGGQCFCGLPGNAAFHRVFGAGLDALLGLLPQLHEGEDLHFLVVRLLLHLVTMLLELDGQAALVLEVEQLHQSPSSLL